MVPQISAQALGSARFFRSTALVAALLLSATVAWSQSQTQRHAALVIATSSLNNSNSDTRAADELADVSAALTQAGFSVTQVINGVDAPGGMNGVAAAFLQASDGADSRVVYVSGRTISADGTVYLLPSTPQNPSAMDLALNGLNINAVAGELAGGDAASLLIVNGAFNHGADQALETSGAFAKATDQLALSDFGADQSIVISTANGTRNLARSNQSHAFDNVAAQVLAQGGVSMRDVIANLVAETRSESRRRQNPQVRSVGTANQTFGAPALPPISSTEQRLWDIASSNDTVDAYSTYLDLFPNGAYADDAVAAIEALTPSERLQPINETYVVARNANLRSGPSTQNEKVATLSAGALLFNEGLVQGERWYKVRLDSGQVAYIFQSLIYPYEGSELQSWNQAQSINSVAGFQRYLDTWPEGVYVDIATAQRDDLIAAERAARLAPYGIAATNGEVFVVRRANVRDLPDGSGQRMTTLSEGTILTLTGRSNVVDWVEVTLPDGRTGYIWAPLVSDYTAPVSPPPQSAIVEDAGGVSLDIFSNQYRVNWEGRVVPISLNGVLYGPSTDRRSNLLAAERRSDGARGYELLAISETTGRYTVWLTDNSGRFQGLEAVNEGPSLEERFGVDLDGDGFVAQVVVTPTPQPPVASIGQRQLNTSAPLMSQLSRRSDVLDSVPAGTVVELLGEGLNGRWSNVRLNDGLQGWIETQYLDDAIAPDELAYQAIAGSADIEAALAFLASFPNSSYAGRVQSVLSQLSQPKPVNETVLLPQQTTLYAAAQTTATRMGSLQANSKIQVNQISGTPQFYRFRLNNGRNAYVLVSDTVPYEGSDQQAWDRAVQTNTVQSVQAYLAEYPNGIYADQARQLVADASNSFTFNLGGIDFNVKLD